MIALHLYCRYDHTIKTAAMGWTEYRISYNSHCHSNTIINVLRKHLFNTHTHTRLTALCPGLPRWASTRKVKPIWILLKQETVSGSGIRWAICKSEHRSRQITTPAPHHSVFLQAGCPSCRPTNSVKALKASTPVQQTVQIFIIQLN